MSCSYYVWYYAPTSTKPETYRYTTPHEASDKALALAAQHDLAPQPVNSADWRVDARKMWP